MGYRIFITGSGIAKEAQQLLIKENCSFEIGDPKDTSDDIARKLELFDPDGIIVRQGEITRKVQSTPKKLRVICKHGVGIDNIDTEAATELGIPVMFTPRANFESAAEHTLALILSLIRRIPIQDKHIRNGIFDKKNFNGLELLGKNLGIIGFGHIGRRVSELVAPFNMKVSVYEPYCKITNLEPHISQVTKLEDILPQADILSLHCPLTNETKGLINKQTISQMKGNALIINTARGGIINESDLIFALQNNQIGGAALDVFEEEPPAADNPLFKMDNVILTTHISGISDNSYKNMGMDAVKNVLSVLKGASLDMESLINKDIIAS